MRKKIYSIILLIILLLNSSLLTIVSTAVEEIENLAQDTANQGKINLDLNYTQLTNKVQNEITITGNIERDSEDDPLYENPIVSIQMPSEVEKVIVNDIKVLYDDELKLEKYEVTQNEEKNQVLKISLEGKQTKYQTDGISKGTAIRISANVILKQDIKTSDTKLVMTCVDGVDNTKTAKCEKMIKVVNSSEIPAIAETTDEQEGTKVYANGLLIENKAILGDTILKDDDIVYDGEIVKYEIKVTNTTREVMTDINIIGHIPEGMKYAELYTNGFWGDDYEYETYGKFKEKSIKIEELGIGETKTYYYEAQVVLSDREKYIEERLVRKLKYEWQYDGEVAQKTSEEYKEFVAELAKQVALGEVETIDDDMQKIIDGLIEKYSKMSFEDLRDVEILKEFNENFEKEVISQIDVLIKDEVISQYSVKHKLKMAEVYTRLRMFADRTNRNEWIYHVDIKNVSENLDPINTQMKMQIPADMNIIGIYDSNVNILENEIYENLYKVENNLITINCDSIKKGETVTIKIVVDMRNLEESEDNLYKYNIFASTISNKTSRKYNSNQVITEGGIEAGKISQSSEKNGEKVKVGDEIIYNFKVENIGYASENFGGFSEIRFEDFVPEYLKIIEVEYDTNTGSYGMVDGKRTYNLSASTEKFSNLELISSNVIRRDNSARVLINLVLKNGETSNIKIKTQVVRTDSTDKSKESDTVIENYAVISGGNIKTKQSNFVKNIIHQNAQTSEIIVKPDPDKKPTDSTKPNPDKTTSTTDTTKPESKTYMISGKAWIDENEDGKIDENELVKAGLNVYLYDITNKAFVTTENGKTNVVKTDKEGKYSFEKVKEGKYYVIIEYDSNEYAITEYQKTGVSELKNCDFITKEVRMFNEQKTVGMTNTIDLKMNQQNIDIGLIENKIFDLKIEQYIEKITVTNSKGTKEYNYKDKKLAKVEIHSKQFNGSTVAIEYKIKVTNVGELSGSVNEIIAEIPEKLDFHSELNSEWSKSMTYNLSNTSYRTTEIKPGESIEAKLVLSKTLTDESAGTYKNTTKIGISENSKHIEDKNQDNDSDSTEVILGVSTGIKEKIEVMIIILLAMMILMFIVMNKKFLKLRNKTFMMFMVFGIVLCSPFFMSKVQAKGITIHGNSHTINDKAEIPDKVYIRITKKTKNKDGTYTYEFNNGDYHCIDPGSQMCSAGHSFSLSDVETKFDNVSNFTSSINEDGGIKVSASIESQIFGEAVINIHVDDTTGASGDIQGECNGQLFSVGQSGGDAQITVSDPGGITGVSIKINKVASVTYTWKEHYVAIYKANRSSGNENCTCPYKEGAIQRMETPYEVSCSDSENVVFSDSLYIPGDKFYKKLIIQKEDAETGDVLSGISFEISGTGFGGTYTTSGGTIVIDNAWAGDFSWTESGWPVEYYYYLNSNGGNGTIDGDVGIVTVKATNYRNTGNLYIKKIDKETGEPLAGVVFDISGLGKYTTDENGEIKIYDIPLDWDGSRIFTCQEIYNPYYGYVADDPEYGGKFDITVYRQSAGETVVFKQNKDKENEHEYSFSYSNFRGDSILTFTRKNSKTGEPLKDVIFDIEGIGEIKTDENGKATLLNLEFDESGKRKLKIVEKYQPKESQTINGPYIYEVVVEIDVNNPKKIKKDQYVIINGMPIKYSDYLKDEKLQELYKQPESTDEDAYEKTYEIEVSKEALEKEVFSGITEQTNKLKYAKLSGYVWEDALEGKDNQGNGLYDESESKQRIPGVKVILHDPVNNTTHETWTDENGEYSFGERQYNGEYKEGMTSNDADYSKDNILLKRASEYWVEFEYNGVKYRNVKLDIDPTKTNASRASEEINSGKDNEDSSMRQNFNNKFSTITSDTIENKDGDSTGIVKDQDGNIVSDSNNNPEKITYNKNGNHQSQINYGTNMTEENGNKVAYGEDIYHIRATTENNYDFSTYLDSVRSTIGYTDEIKYVNLGVYSREQVDVAISADVKDFVLDVNGYKHTYIYGKSYNDEKLKEDSQETTEDKLEEQMGVKLKEVEGKYYERPLHEADVAYSETDEGAPNIYADITYKVYLQNKSNSLTAQIKQLTIDYDEDLYLNSYKYKENGKDTYTEVKVLNNENTGGINGNKHNQNVETEVTVNGTTKLEEATLNIETSEKIPKGEYREVEVTFRVYADTIKKVLNDENGIKFDLMAEVKTYSTYANNEANKFNRADTEGTYAYASIDKNSAARNAIIEINGNKFVTEKFENDTTIAPTFRLTKGSTTTLSGIVYEDSPLEDKTVKINNNNKVYERIGDGKYNNENVMKNVLVELIKVTEDVQDKKYSASEARQGQEEKQVYSQDDENIAHLYKTPTEGQRVDTGVLARTYTKADGTYEFSGVIPGKYVIRFVYGTKMKEIDSKGKYIENGRNNVATTIYDKSGNQLKEIEAREYKSTIITGDYISTALKITNGKEELNGDYSWFLNDKDENGIRYSDAVDDVEYRAQLEKNATVDSQVIKGERDYIYTEMQAHTPYFILGVEEKNNFQENTDLTYDEKILENEENKNVLDLKSNPDGTLDYEYAVKNVDFGIIERPIVDLKVDKTITGLKVSLGNGQVLINGNPQEDNLPYVRTGLGDFVPIEMDTEILHNATIEEEYTITVTNNSELDYSIYPILSGETFDSEIVAKRREYYYYGETNNLSEKEKNDAVTTRISILADYLGAELTADEETMKDDKWEAKALGEITEYQLDGRKINLLSDVKIKDALEKGKYSIYTTDVYNDPSEDGQLVRIGDEKSIKYNVSRLLAVNTDTMKYTNDIEILQYAGYSQNKDRTEDRFARQKDTTPGNLMPGGAKEDDEDSVRTTITPPTGTVISRWLYVITSGIGLVSILLTIVFIRKRILIN